MNGQIERDYAKCAHVIVERFQIEKDGKVFEEQWRCKDCGAKFVTLDSLFSSPQQIQLMEPVKTLRDDFAMAAMIADALASAVVAVSYMAQGKHFVGDYPKTAEGAAEYYKTADCMIEARK